MVIKSPIEKNFPHFDRYLSLGGRENHDLKWGVLHDPRDEKTENEYLSNRQRAGQRPEAHPQMTAVFRTVPY